jgi:hypothetical protein
VARLNPRLAAGVGVLSVFLLLGGPGAAAAIADDGDSGSQRGSSSDRDDRYERDGWDGDDRDGGGDDSNGGIRRGDDNAERDSNDGPRVRLGSGRGDTQELMPGGSGSGGSGSSDRSGSDHPGTPKTGFERPRVTVGNGRSPGIQSDDPEPRWRAPAPDSAPAPPPPPPPPVVAPPPRPSFVNKLVSPPATPQLTGARSGLAPGSLFGLAGLVLIPAAGAYLGYRQAKGAHAAAESLGPSGKQ